MNVFLLFLVLCFLLGGNNRIPYRGLIIVGLSLLLTVAYFFLNQL